MTAAVDRPFGFWLATALVIGNIVGAGIFVLPSQLASYGATGAVAWFVTIAGSLALGWALAGLTRARPQSPSSMAICSEALGPMAGLLIGWSYWVSTWASLAVIASSAARYLATFVPVLADTPLHLSITAVALLGGLTLFNLRGVRSAGHFQLVTTLLKLLPLLAVVIILAGLALAGGGRFHETPHAALSAGQLTPAITLAMFALIGFESASLAAERVRDPQRNVVRATLAGLVITGLLYVIVCTGIVFAMPEAELAAANAPMALFVATFWGSWAGYAVAAFAAIAAIGCLNGWILLQGEMPLSMVRAGVLPTWIARPDARGVAVTPIVASSVLAAVLVLSSASRGTAGLFDFMMRLTSATNMFLYIGIGLAALVFRTRPVAGALGLAFALWVLWGSGLEAGGWGIVLMLTALPLYWLRPRSAEATTQPAE